MLLGGALGMVAAFLQILEKLTLLKNKDAILSCDINSVFSCSSVLNAWQSSVFGFPNSVMCLVLFTIFTTIAIAGVTGAQLPPKLRLAIQVLSLGTLGFALWFLGQSIYSIGSLCILCIFCFGGLLLVNWGWLRLNAAHLPIGKRGTNALAQAFAKGADIFVWFLLAALVAFAMALRFG